VEEMDYRKRGRNLFRHDLSVTPHPTKLYVAKRGGGGVRDGGGGWGRFMYMNG